MGTSSPPLRLNHAARDDCPDWLESTAPALSSHSGAPQRIGPYDPQAMSSDANHYEPRCDDTVLDFARKCGT